MRLLGLQGFDHLQEMAHRAGQTVEADHNQDLPWLDLTDEPRQHRPGPARARPVLLMDHLTTSPAQLVELGVMRLILSGDTSVANQASFEEGGAINEFPKPFSSPLYTFACYEQLIV